MGHKRLWKACTPTKMLSSKKYVHLTLGEVVCKKNIIGMGLLIIQINNNNDDDADADDGDDADNGSSGGDDHNYHYYY